MGQSQISRMAPMILQPSKLCSENEIEVIGILQQVCEIYYGLSPVNLNINLWLASFDAICERFKGITIQDIQNSYRYAEIEKKAYTTLTRDELINPIVEYWIKRNILLAEIEKIQNAKVEELQAVEADRNFKMKAKQLYIDSLNEGKWLGDEFEADAIARNFKEVLQQPEKRPDQAVPEPDSGALSGQGGPSAPQTPLVGIWTEGKGRRCAPLLRGQATISRGTMKSSTMPEPKVTDSQPGMLKSATRVAPVG